MGGAHCVKWVWSSIERSLAIAGEATRSSAELCFAFTAECLGYVYVMITVKITTYSCMKLCSLADIPYGMHCRSSSVDVQRGGTENWMPWKSI